MTPRNAFGVMLLVAAAAGSWYIASSLDSGTEITDTGSALQQGFYLRDARILGTGESGKLVYEITADYAEQKGKERIEFEGVKINYTPDSAVPWSVSADKAEITGNLQMLTLSGNVVAVSDEGFAGKVSRISTDWLELEPDKFLAQTDRRVLISIGDRSISATGMEASLRENRMQLKSNVSGKFVP
ncbi:MAG: LPS export ABC transporter periplasmic protein LptC [Woeseia sp.]